jgi:hypothetical protein
MPCAPAKRDSQQANVTIKVNDKTATATLVRARDAKSAKPQPAHRISIPHHVTCSQFIHSTRLDARGLCRRVSCATVRPHFRTADLNVPTIIPVRRLSRITSKNLSMDWSVDH